MNKMKRLAIDNYPENNGKELVMVITLDWTSLEKKIKDGERVLCPKCKKGSIVPLNPEAKINHSFNCDNCDYHIHFGPLVIIDWLIDCCFRSTWAGR